MLHETNSFLHTNSNTPGLLPNDIVNASDGVGTWDRVHNGVAKVAFRKMLFNGARQNFGDLHVTGTVTSNGTHLHGDWYIEIRGPQRQNARGLRQRHQRRLAPHLTRPQPIASERTAPHAVRFWKYVV